MVHWQWDTTATVLIIFSSLHFGLVRSDCSAGDWTDIDRRSVCALDKAGERRDGHLERVRDERFSSGLVKGRRVDDLWRQSELERRGL